MAEKRRQAQQSGSNKVPSPVQRFLNWNPTHGRWAYSTPGDDGEKGDIRNIKAIILQPDLYKVTGGENGNRVFSNMGQTFRHDLLTVWVKPKNGKAKKLNETPGPWAEIKKEVTAEHGRYAKIVAAYLISGEKAIYDSQSGKTGEFKKTSFNELVFLQMSGNAIMAGWGDSLEATGLTERDVIGMGISQKDTIQVAGRKRGEIWLHAVYQFSELNPDDPKQAELIAKGDAITDEVLDPYLDAYFKTPDYLKDDKEEEEEEEYTPATIKSSSKGKGFKEKKEEEDFPF